VIGPKDQWQVELEKISKPGLVALVEMMFAFYVPGRDEKIATVKSARKAGRVYSAIKSLAEYDRDPDRYIDKIVRRKRAAKKAARRRKKERRSK